jgi:Uncharacterised protein family (UPF0137)
MTNVNSLLTERLKSAKEKLTKMTNLVERSSKGELSSFSGVFQISGLTEREKETLQGLLNHYKNEEQEITDDLLTLSSLTAEVKAINNQAILLHGERIQRAQEILKNYREGAFSAWLIATYGNRQTPYNFLQYYELYSTLPQVLHAKMDEMPRQAVYSLASRAGEYEQKENIIKNYNGEPKEELLHLIREQFPLSTTDRRAQDLNSVVITTLIRLKKQLQGKKSAASISQKTKIQALLEDLKEWVND